MSAIRESGKENDKGSVSDFEGKRTACGLAHHFIITIAYPLITSSNLEGENREMKDES